MKTVVITGSTRGIGRGLAENFLKQGCQVVITSRKAEAVSETVQLLATEFGQDKVKGCPCDVTQAESIQALIDFARQGFGKIDIWVNNAGMSIARKPLHSQASNDLIKLVSTNLTSILLTNKLVIEIMEQQGGGQIWNMEGFGSNDATQPGMTAYGATKRALTYINKSLQKELKDSPVHVNTLSPGIVVTELLLGDYDLASPEWQKAKKIFNILGDTVETVTPYLVEGILKSNKPASKVVWLTGFKAFTRFLTAGFNKRDLFAEQ